MKEKAAVPQPVQVNNHIDTNRVLNQMRKPIQAADVTNHVELFNIFK